MKNLEHGLGQNFCCFYLLGKTILLRGNSCFSCVKRHVTLGLICFCRLASSFEVFYTTEKVLSHFSIFFFFLGGEAYFETVISKTKFGLLQSCFANIHTDSEVDV